MATMTGFFNFNLQGFSHGFIMCIHQQSQLHPQVQDLGCAVPVIRYYKWISYDIILHYIHIYIYYTYIYIIHIYIHIYIHIHIIYIYLYRDIGLISSYIPIFLVFHHGSPGGSRPLRPGWKSCGRRQQRRLRPPLGLVRENAGRAAGGTAARRWHGGDKGMYNVRPPSYKLV